MKEEISCGVVIIRKEKQENLFLVLKMIDGHYGFPKGHIEENETIKETALRELKEETGISDVNLVDLPIIKEEYSFYRGDKKSHKINRYFIGFVKNNEVIIQKEEISKYQWISYEEALKLLDFESSKKVLNTANEYTISNLSKKIGFINKHNILEKEGLTLPLSYGNRVVIITKEGKIVLIKYNSNIHVLPGGHIEDDEEIYESIKRESKEETGYNIEKIKSLGFIEIYKKKYRRIIFGALYKTVGSCGNLSLTKEELKLGHKVYEYSIEEALKILEENIERTTSSASIRSLMFLKEAQKYL